MAQIVGYIGSSIDGFIADKDEKLDWLDAYDDVDYGEFDYTHFIKSIGTIVMGRGTYDWLQKAVSTWPYPDHESIIVTSKSIIDLPKNVTVWSKGIETLIPHLRGIEGKNAWICGGGQLQSAFIAKNALDYLEIYVVPTIVGDGIRLWPGMKQQCLMDLDDVRHLSKGVVRMAYRRRELGVT